MRCKSKNCLILLFLLTTYHLPLTTAHAEVSTDVPVDHWSYEAVGKLVLAGMIDGFNITGKPWTRVQMAELVSEGVEKVISEEFEMDYGYKQIRTLEDMLYKLVDEYRDELLGLGVFLPDIDEDRPLKFSKGRFRAFFDEFRSDKIYASTYQKRRIRYENERGWSLYDGLNTRVYAKSRFKYGKYLAGSITPSVRHSEEETDFLFEEGYVKLSAGNLELEAGRNSLWWGVGYHGTLLLSDNSYPLDMVKLATRNSFRMPSFFKRMGRWNAAIFLSQLGKERTVPKPYFGGWRIELSPFKLLNIAVTKTVQFGGEGTNLSLGDWIEAYDFEDAGGEGEKANHLVMLDAVLNIPRIDRFIPIATGMQVYFEWGAEDEAGAIPQIYSNLVGGWISDLGMVPGLDLRIEYTKIDNRWYEHFRYTDYTYKDNILGHHAGRDADDIFIQISQLIEDKWKVVLSYDFENRGRSNSFIETRRETKFFIRWSPKEWVDVEFGYEQEYIENLDNASKEGIRDHILSLNGKVKF